MTQARGRVSSQRDGGRGGGTEDRRCAGCIPFAGAKLRNPPRFRRPPAFFLHRRAVVRRAPRPLFPPRLVRSKSCAFFVSAPLFFRRSPALFSFGGWVAPSVGVKCAVPRVRVSRTHPPFFNFCLHRFTSPRQHTHTQAVVCEGFTPFCLHPCLPPLPPVRAAPQSRGEDGREVRPSPTTH